MADLRITPLVEELEQDLCAVGDEERAIGAKAYLKSDQEFIGVAAKPLREVARAFLADHPEVDRKVLVDLVLGLWQRPVFELFASFASQMVGEREFFIRKAIGWVLRDVSKKRPDLAFNFLLNHVQEVSGLTLREGSKYLPDEDRERLRRLRR